MPLKALSVLSGAYDGDRLRMRHEIEAVLMVFIAACLLFRLKTHYGLSLSYL